jgi:pilus assembly protein CpaB
MKFAPNRSWLILGTALVIGGVAAFGVNRYIARQVADIEGRGKDAKTVKVVVPKQDLPKGTVLTSALVAQREMPAEWAHSNAITPEQFDRIENQTLAYPAARGEMLLWSLLEGQRAPTFSSRLALGRRAITVPVDEVNSISGLVEPGDRIDLVVSAKRDNKTYMFPLLQNVTILATGTRAVVDAAANDGRQRTFTTITLDASPEEAQRVLAAREVGKIAALLRAPGDSQRAAGDRRDAMALLGIGGGEPVAYSDNSVPVLYGGSSGAVKDLRPLRGSAAGTAAGGAAAAAAAPFADAVPQPRRSEPLKAAADGAAAAGAAAGATDGAATLTGLN